MVTPGASRPGKLKRRLIRYAVGASAALAAAALLLSAAGRVQDASDRSR